MYCPLDKSSPCPFPIRSDQVYLGEDEQGYYVMDGFFSGLGNMFKRMVKFTPKSFTPSNIFKGVRNTMLTTMTGGAYLAFPKGVKKTMENVANIAIPVAAGAATAMIAGPAIMGVIGPKLSMVAGALGKNVSTIGQGLFSIMGKLSPAQQSQVAQKVTSQDLLYAEQHQGQFPAQFMNYVDEVAKQNYFPAYQASQTDTRALYADASLYPGLQQARLDAQLGQSQQTEPAGNWLSGEVAGAVGAAVLVVYLIGRK